MKNGMKNAGKSKMKSERIFLTAIVFIITLSLCIGSVNALVLGAYPVSEQDPLGMGVQNIVSYQNANGVSLVVKYSDGTIYQNANGNAIRIARGSDVYQRANEAVNIRGNGAIFAPYDRSFTTTTSSNDYKIGGSGLGAYPVSDKDPLGMGVQNIVTYKNANGDAIVVVYSDGTIYQKANNAIKIVRGADVYQNANGVVNIAGNGAIFAPYAGSLSTSTNSGNSVANFFTLQPQETATPTQTSGKKTTDSNDLGVNYYTSSTQTSSSTSASTTNSYSYESLKSQFESYLDAFVYSAKNYLYVSAIAVILFILILIFASSGKEEQSESKNDGPLLNWNESDDDNDKKSSTTSYNHQQDQTEVHYHINAENYFANDVGILAKDEAVINRSNIGNDSAKEEPEFSFCPKCGAKVGAEDSFCRKCGEKLN